MTLEDIVSLNFKSAVKFGSRSMLTSATKLKSHKNSEQLNMHVSRYDI